MDNGIYTCIYQGKDGLLGFKKGKEYTISVDKPPNACYNIKELTEDLFIQLSSEISINQHFKNIKKED